MGFWTRHSLRRLHRDSRLPHCFFLPRLQGQERGLCRQCWLHSKRWINFEREFEHRVHHGYGCEMEWTRLDGIEENGGHDTAVLPSRGRTLPRGCTSPGGSSPSVFHPRITATGVASVRGDNRLRRNNGILFFFPFLVFFFLTKYPILNKKNIVDLGDKWLNGMHGRFFTS